MADAEKKKKNPKKPKSMEEEAEAVGNKEKEGKRLMGSPTFEELENGRLRCVETGHELLAKEKESYACSKRCRLGLIDAALAQKKAPLNMFKQDPLCRSKLVCKLTGDVINKSEEHIWKHINGRRFLNKLEQKETEKLPANRLQEALNKKKLREVSQPVANGVKKKKERKVDNNCQDNVQEEDESDSEKPEFWVPPVGSRWDFDDGGDRWGSGPESGGSDQDGEMDEANEEDAAKSVELSMRTKRMSIEAGPSSFASRKKKRKTDSANGVD